MRPRGSSRQAEHDVDETTQERSSTPHGKDSIDKTTRTVIDTVGEADDKRLIRLDQWSGCKNDTLHWARTDGIHPSCNHPSEATNQIASACKAKNYIHRSTAAQRERRPRASEKRQNLLPSQDIEKVTEKPLNSTFFFSSFFAANKSAGGGKGTGTRHLPYRSGRTTPE